MLLGGDVAVDIDLVVGRQGHGLASRSAVGPTSRASRRPEPGWCPSVPSTTVSFRAHSGRARSAGAHQVMSSRPRQPPAKWTESVATSSPTWPRRTAEGRRHRLHLAHQVARGVDQVATHLQQDQARHGREIGLVGESVGAQRPGVAVDDTQRGWAGRSRPRRSRPAGRGTRVETASSRGSSGGCPRGRRRRSSPPGRDAQRAAGFWQRT